MKDMQPMHNALLHFVGGVTHAYALQGILHFFKCHATAKQDTDIFRCKVLPVGDASNLYH